MTPRELSESAYPDLFAKQKEYQDAHAEVTEWLNDNALSEDVEIATVVMVQTNKLSRLSIALKDMDKKIKAIDELSLRMLHVNGAYFRAVTQMKNLKAVIKAMAGFDYKEAFYSKTQTSLQRELKEREAAIAIFNQEIERYPEYAEPLEAIRDGKNQRR